MWRAPEIRMAAGPWLAHLDVGVEIFFVLSGFVVSRPFVAALARGAASPSTRRYFIRRATRLWPAYLVALAAAIALGITHINGATGLMKHATLTYTYFDDRGGQGLRVAWTLVIEVSFYLLVPVLTVAARGASPRRPVRAFVLMTTVLVGVGVLSQWIVAADTSTAPWVRILPPALLTLGLGMLLAAASVTPATRLTRWITRIAARPAVLVAIALAILVFLATNIPVIGGTPIFRRPGDRFTQSLLQAVIAIALVIPAALAPSGGRYRRVLEHPSVVWIGVASYGIYLWHVPMLSALRDWVSDGNLAVSLLGACVAVGATIAIAAASFRFLERPLLDRVSRPRGRSHPGRTTPPGTERALSSAP